MPSQESSSADVKRALQEARRKSQGVPDYSRRSTRMRIFFWVAAVALIIMILSRVRDPSFRYFIGLENRPIANGPPLTEQEIADQSVDTLLGVIPPVDAEPSSKAPTADQAAQSADESAQEPPERWGVAESDSPQELVTATLDAWSQILAQLNGDEQLLLYAALDAIETERRLPASDEAAWRTLIDRIGQEWKAYVTRARGSLDTLPADEQTRWNGRLDTLAERWPKYWAPLLETWVGDEPVDQKMRPVAARLVKLLDVAALATIRDDTVARPAEKAIWFRLFANLRDTPPEELSEQSLGPTGYLSLLKQPRDYRGKVVLVRGIARLAYYVDAPKNRPGIPGYYLFWVNPSGGPNSPIVAYSLELPPGFPPISARAKGTTELHEEVAFEGYFFKRWAYSAQDGIRVAPLVLARMPDWQAPPPSDTESTPWLAIALFVSLTAVVGITLAVVMMRKTTG